jgi:hypothetical protein
VEYSLGLLTNDGRVKEQGRMFQRLAAKYRGKPVVYPATPLRLPPKEATVVTTWRWILDGLRAKG